MNIATVGTSWITGAFIDATKDVSGLQVTAVYSRIEESAAQFANEHRVDKYFTDLEEMAQDDSFDCVYIASPNGLHFEQAILFLKHKKHVFCEKPIFSNIRELDKAYEIAEENGVFLFEAMRNIQMPNYQTLKNALSKLGKINSVTLNFASFSSRYENVLRGEEPNIFSLDYSGGALVDIGVYPLAVAIGLFGRPKQATYYPVIISTGVDGSGTLVLTYDDFVCTILVSKISTTYQPSEIQGDEGTIIINDTGTFSEVDFMSVVDAKPEVIAKGHSLHEMAYEVAAFYEIIQKNDQEEYKRLQEITYEVLRVTESVRKENGIIFTSEK